MRSLCASSVGFVECVLLLQRLCVAFAFSFIVHPSVGGSVFAVMSLVGLLMQLLVRPFASLRSNDFAAVSLVVLSLGLLIALRPPKL